jgi:protein-disulfide isomerase
VAQGSSKPQGSNKPQGNKRNSQGKSGGAANRQAAAKPSGAGRKPAAGRQSVAAARQSTSSNRTQLIIGGIAIAVIIAIIAIGLVMNKKESAIQSEGYGASTQSVATESNGIVTVSKPGTTPGTTIDVYEDALCPVCAEFERQFGQQINKALDEGTLAVNFHMLTFLDTQSFSQDYSTRASAALLCVAQQGGSTPGVYMKYHSTLLDSGTQPEERGTADLTNEQLAELATSSGAPAGAAECITSGQNIAAAEAAATASTETLRQATGGQVATPTVVHNGAPVQLSVDWLSTLLGQS